MKRRDVSIATTLRRTLRRRHQPDWRIVVTAYLASPHDFWGSGAPRHADKVERNKRALRERDGLDDGEIIDAVVSMASKRRHARPAPVYITGLGGSGSHWLSGMLNDLGGLVAAGEVYFPPRLLERLQDLDQADQACAVDAVHLLHGWPRTPDVWTAGIVNCAAGVQKLRFYKRCDPHAFGVYLVRDPRDQVLSVTFRKAGFRRYEDPDASDAEYLRRMAERNVASFRQSRDVADLIDIQCRYEDLRADPRPVLRQVLEALGRPVDEATIEHSATMHDAATIRAGKGTKITNLDEGGRAQTWDQIDPGQQRMLHAHLVDVVHGLGYPPGDCMGVPLPEHALPARTVRFPHGSPGPLYGRTHGTWTRLEASAAGIEVPAGTPTLLRIGGEGGHAAGRRGRQADGQRTAGGLRALEHCDDEIQALCVAGNPDIDDDALALLSGLTGLRALDLARTQVTDSGLKHLESLKGLQQLQLAETATTAEGRARLAAHLSQLTIWI